jgi:hypothetical protein
LRDLQQVGGDEHHIEDAEAAGRQRGDPGRLLPHEAHDGEEQQGVDEHRPGHRDAVGGGEVRGRPEGEQQHQHADQQEGVHLRHEDLAGLGLRRAADVDAREEAELHRLLGHREGPGDHRLRRDHGGDHRQDQNRPVDRLRDHVEEGIRPGAGMGQHQRALAQVVEQQRRKHEAQPSRADRLLSEVTHVGIERLRPGDRQEDAAEDDEAQEAVLAKEDHAVVRQERPDDRGVVGDVVDAQPGDHQEPEAGDRAEEPRHAGGAPGLHQEQADQDAGGNGYDQLRHARRRARRIADAFDGR